MSATMLKSWSASRYNTYEQCPRKAKYSYLDKLPQPPALPLERGNLIHKQAESFIKGEACPVLDESKPIPKLNMDGSWADPKKVKFYKLGVLPPTLETFAELFTTLKPRYKKKMRAMAVESTWAFRQDWSKTVGTDWTGCHLRIKVDCAYEIDDDVLIIEDWKTGKYNADLAEDYKKALQLYALGGLLWYPHIKKVRPRLRYTDIGVSWPEGDAELEYDRGDIPKLKELWETRTKPMLNDTIFAPRPNSKCKWCPFSKAAKGPCEF